MKSSAVDTQFQSHPFAPVYDGKSRILILGSFPSVRSREEGFYYGHPRNRFWPLLALCFGESAPKGMEEKRSFLLRHEIALWDVLSSCHIAGPADSTIRSAMPNDIQTVTGHAPIRRVLCNGSTAGKLCSRYFGEHLGCEVIVLPSTSPANASWSMERLHEAWKPWLNF